MDSRVRVGLVGSQFISAIHAEALQQCAAAEIVAVASPTRRHVEAFAEKFNIPGRFTDYREMLALAELDLVLIGRPTTCIARSRWLRRRPASTSSARSRCA